MPRPLQWLLSLVFITQMYLSMALLALAMAIPALLSRDMAFAAVHIYCRWVRFTARALVGLRSEIRGEVPQGEVLIAAKHQSFFDIILLCSVLPRPKFFCKIAQAMLTASEQMKLERSETNCLENRLRRMQS